MGMRWISVKEKLPEDDKSVLITYHFGNPKKKYVEEASCYKGTWSSPNDEYLVSKHTKHVIAWMPLPKPYKAESEDSPKIDCSKTKCKNCTNHSYCDACHHKLSFLDMVPVISYICLRVF